MKLRYLYLMGWMLLFLHCNNSESPSQPPSPPGTKLCLGSTSLPSVPTEPSSSSGIIFSPVGESLGSNQLIDLEFLPQQNGDVIIIGKDGAVYYQRNSGTFVQAPDSFAVENEGEQGMLNVAADPQYSNNCFVYFYFTPPGGGINRVVRGTVNFDGANFSISDRQLIIDFSKGGDNNNPSPGSNHNGGSLLFDENNLLIGVGDGGGGGSSNTSANIGQRGNTRLGKVLRIAPHRIDGEGGFSIPAEGNGGGSGDLPEIFARGLRNPFTMTGGTGFTLVGDVGAVGAGSFEEINLITRSGQNFGWPQVEGPGGSSAFTDPIGGYSHTTGLQQNNNEDPEENSGGGVSIMVGSFYTGPRYRGFLSNTLIYSDFFQGFVRGLRLNQGEEVTEDLHLGHLEGISSIQQSPDGFLYATSLFGSDRIMRIELRP